MKKPKSARIFTKLRKKQAELDRLLKQERAPEGRIRHVDQQIARLIPLLEDEVCKLYS